MNQEIKQFETKEVAKHAPIKKYKAGGISLNVWENSTLNGTFKSFTMDRRYKNDKTGEWHSTQSYRATDLPKIVSLMTQAFDEHIRGATISTTELVEPEEKI